MLGRGFVDCHSHVVPSGDDGAASVPEGIALCHDAARHGTALLFATPHVWPHLLLSEERERAVRRAFARVAPSALLELRLGWELTPCTPLLQEDPWRYELGGTGCVLMEVPFAGRADLLFALAEHAARAGLKPIVAHPERGESVRADPGLAAEIASRGWLIQVNATSLSGYHGPEVEALAWRLLDEGHAALVGSDGHREARPARLDEAARLVEARYGVGGSALFDGTALAPPIRSWTASRVASRGA